MREFASLRERNDLILLAMQDQHRSAVVLHRAEAVESVEDSELGDAELMGLSRKREYPEAEAFFGVDALPEGATGGVLVENQQMARRGDSVAVIQLRELGAIARAVSR